MPVKSEHTANTVGKKITSFPLPLCNTRQRDSAALDMQDLNASLVQKNRSSLLRPDIPHTEVSGNFAIKFNEISIRLIVSRIQYLLDIRIYSFFLHKGDLFTF